MAIETIEGLNSAFEDFESKQTAFEKSVAELQEQNTELATTLEASNATNEEAKSTIALFEEKLKTLQTVIKNERAIDQVMTQEGHDYRLGKMAMEMYMAKLSGTPREGAIKAMADMGAIPTQASVLKDTGPIEIVKGYNAEKVAAVSTDPLTSDDSDAGNWYGSYLVPVDTAAECLRVARDSSAMMGQVTTRPVRGITTYLPTTTEEFAFTAVSDQETAKTEEDVTFAKTTLTVVTYALWIAITEEADEDSLIALGTLIRTLSAEAWALKFDQLCLSDSTYGAMATSGINNVTMSAGNTGFSNISAGDLDDMIAALTTQNKRKGAKFFMHPTVWDHVAILQDANGNYIVRDRFGEKEALRVRGYDVVLSDGMPSTSAASTDFVAFGNPSYIVNGTKVGFEFRVFDQTYATMQYDQFFLRARLRQAFALWAPSAWVKLTTAAS